MCEGPCALESCLVQVKQEGRLWLQGEQVRGVYDGSGAAESRVAAVEMAGSGSHPASNQASLLGFEGAKR